VEFHPSAFKHGYDEAAITHVLNNAILVCDAQPGSDPPKRLAIGPARSAGLVEVVWLELADFDLVIHAMDLRPQLYRLLPSDGGTP